MEPNIPAMLERDAAQGYLRVFCFRNILVAIATMALFLSLVPVRFHLQGLISLPSICVLVVSSPMQPISREGEDDHRAEWLVSGPETGP